MIEAKAAKVASWNLILAGVGGQGILTIAQIISQTAMRRGWHVKQAEVHGMSQRGGAVQSHLRVSEAPIYSDLVPRGEADLLIAVEPLESLRYIDYLSPQATIVAGSTPVVNIPNYPPIEEVFARIGRHARHVLVDAERLAREAGSVRANNVALLGAASSFLGFEIGELEQTIAEVFASKGSRVVDVNRRALHYGRAAGQAYLRALMQGVRPQAVREWLDSVSVDELSTDLPDATIVSLHERPDELTQSERQVIAKRLKAIADTGRRRLYEHEVYSLVELVGAISPPRHVFVPQGATVSTHTLAPFPGDKVVLKIVSPDIVHKSDMGGLAFVDKNAEVINHRLQRCHSEHCARGRRVEGALIVEYVEHDCAAFGEELFVGIRSSRQFGPVIAAGLGGVHTEYFAGKMKSGIAVAKALAAETSAEEFFALFKKTAAYEFLAGLVRGHKRKISDTELLRCFRAFIAFARAFCGYTPDTPKGIVELEVNPFAFVDQWIVPLDGRGRLGTLRAPAPPRPLDKTLRLLEPRSIAVMGVSSSRANFGRIILNNVKEGGFPQEHLYVIKDQKEPIDGVPCIGQINAAPEQIDVLVAATAAEHIPQIIEQATAGNRVSSVILIPGGLGETEGTESLQKQLRKAIAEARLREEGGPVFLGGNSLGVRTPVGQYDTFFIERKKFPRRKGAAQRLALVSQSGAFIITRMSNLEFLDPAFAVSVGNQLDLTLSDIVEAVGTRDDIDCIGIYAEGFGDLDGLALARIVREVTHSGKVVVFYKAGRTSVGREATRGHTASLAGDYDVCQQALTTAGAIVVDTFKEFEQLVDLATHLHTKRVHGQRIGVISNAGYETVGMADALQGARYQVEMSVLSEQGEQKIGQILHDHGLSALINVRNPLDLTPMADDDVYAACVRAMLEEENIDAVIVSLVPLTAKLKTAPDEINDPGALALRLPEILAQSKKPLVCVVDSGPPFEELIRTLRRGGVPVFCSCDQAIRSLGRYLCGVGDRQE